MKLDISKAISQENREFREKVQIDMETFESKQGDFPILTGEPFDLTIVNEDSKRLRLSAETEVTIQMPCDRCLETVEVPFSIQIDKELPLQSEYSDTEEKEDDGSMDEADSYMEDGELDIDRLIYNEILVNWPAKVLCKPDCKGICPKCGTNLNLETCDCEPGELDPRMAAFQDVFNKFKEV